MKYTQSQIALGKFIQAENAERQARMDSTPGLICGMVCDDPDHWAGYGIYTIDGYKHYMAACDNFELVRAIYGHKPAWNYDSMTLEEIEADTEAMLERERAQEAADAADAEKLAAELGHDVETLKRWEVV